MPSSIHDDDNAQIWSNSLGILRSGGLLCPLSLNLPSPLNLRGLNVSTLNKRLATDRHVLNFGSVSQALEFSSASLRNVDLTAAQLSSSKWLDCEFESVRFDRAILCDSSFLGCRFSNCTFTTTNLQNSSFSLGRNGAETSIVASTFDGASFRGASCSNPAFRSTLFRSCNLEGFVFDGPMCDGVAFSGSFRELTFRGLPKDDKRNQLRIDLSQAAVMWLNADDGIDLRQVVLPLDGSCIVLKNRIRAIESLCLRLPQEVGATGKKVAGVLQALYSANSISALEPTQDTVFISKAMIADFADTEDNNLVETIFDRIRSIAESEGALVQ